MNIPAMVTDSRGKYIQGLRKEDFRLYEDGVEQPIAVFAASEEPVNVALLLDTSKSTVTVLDKIRKAAGKFVAQLRLGDRALVMTFDRDIRLLSPLNDDRKEVQGTIKDVEPGEYVGTRLRDAVFDLTSRRLKQAAGRKAIVILSDGQDYGSQVSTPDLLASVAESGSLIYSIFYSVDVRALARELFGVSLPRGTGRAPDSEWARREQQAAAFMAELSELSAGRFMRSEISDLSKIFAAIVEELRYQYVLGFYPEKARLDGAAHTLDVRVQRQGVSVRARRGYRILRQS